MVVWRCIHKSKHELEVGDILLPPTELCRADKGARGGPLKYANFREYCQGQHENVYFSMLGSEAERQYGGGPHVYVVEPLDRVEKDPEDTVYNYEPYGSLRASSARVVEVIA